MTIDRLDSIRHSVLRRMDRAERDVRVRIFGAALTELVLFVIAFRLVDMSNRIERLVFVYACITSRGRVSPRLAKRSRSALAP